MIILKVIAESGSNFSPNDNDNDEDNDNGNDNDEDNVILKVIAESGSNFSPSLHSITASQAARWSSKYCLFGCTNVFRKWPIGAGK